MSLSMYMEITMVIRTLATSAALALTLLAGACAPVFGANDYVGLSRTQPFGNAPTTVTAQTATKG